jgi:tetratricopeptide (TPR) repeat protein
MNVEVFLSYSDKDEELKNELEKQLDILKSKGLIDIWHEGKISGDREENGEIYLRLNSSQIILLLVSPDFLSSNYCSSLEIKLAIARHQQGEACVIPVLIRPTDSWQETLVGNLPSLPKNGLAVTDWEENKEEAFTFITLGIAQEILEFKKRFLGEEDSEIATYTHNLATLYRMYWLYDEAESLYIQALELKKRIFGDRHLEVVRTLDNLAALYESQNRYEDAEILYQDILEIRKEILGEEHPDIATSLNNLALLYYAQKRYEDAETLYKEALEMRKNILGDIHPDVAKTLNNLATLYSAKKDYREALPLFQQALEIATQTLGEDHPSTITIRENVNSHKNMPLWQTLKWYLIFQFLYEIFT